MLVNTRKVEKDTDTSPRRKRTFVSRGIPFRSLRSSFVGTLVPVYYYRVILYSRYSCNSLCFPLYCRYNDRVNKHGACLVKSLQEDLWRMRRAERITPAWATTKEVCTSYR